MNDPRTSVSHLLLLLLSINEIKNKNFDIHVTLVSRHGRGQGDKTLPYAKFKRPWEISRKLGSVVETFLNHNDNTMYVISTN